MEQNKPELKHISPYLPFGLKCQLNRLGIFNLDEEYPIPHNDICEITNLAKIGDDWEIEISGSGDYSFGMIGLDEIDILLRPLSDLYKEIDGVVGIVELAKIVGLKNVKLGKLICFKPCAIAHPNFDSFAYYFWWDKYEECFIMGNSHNPTGGCVIKNQLDLFTYLFEHHYDVFNLIGQNLAIDLNSISHGI